MELLIRRVNSVIDQPSFREFAEEISVLTQIIGLSPRTRRLWHEYIAGMAKESFCNILGSRAPDAREIKSRNLKAVIILIGTAIVLLFLSYLQFNYHPFWIFDISIQIKIER